jgi:GNAT superfamily N-acetyltransferase
VPPRVHPAMDDRELFDRQYASLREFCRVIGGASPGARVFDRGGVLASVVPATPDRAVMNSVAYLDAAELEQTLPELAATYSEAGVRAWTVWVPQPDTAAAAALEEAGHVLDADPAAMAMELAGYDVPRPTDLDLDPEPDLATVARLNDLSYEVEGDHFVHGLRHAPALRCYVARIGEEPVACATGHDHDGDFSVTFVATVPKARGQGLAARLMTHALVEARERGCDTTSLQATRMGRPIYERLGYRDLGPVQMWERRAPKARSTGL